MSQQEIIEVLEKHKNKPFTRSEIAALLEIGVTAVSHALKSLVDNNEVKIIEIGREEAMKKYRCKRRIRLYYLD